MQNFPLDDIIKNCKSQGVDIKSFSQSFFQSFLKNKNSINFYASLKRIEIELDEYEKLILNILKPSIDKETQKARQRNSYKPSKYLFDKKTGSPLKLPGYRNEYKRQFMQLSYIGLYHKTENAELELLEHLNKLFNSNYQDLSEINFNSRDKEIFKGRDRLRVIANWLKHNQGLANKQVCSYYSKFILGKPIDLTFANFKRDLNAIKKYHKQLSLFLVLLTVKKSVDVFIDSDLFKEDINTKNNLIDFKKDTKQIISLFTSRDMFEKKNGTQ